MSKYIFYPQKERLNQALKETPGHSLDFIMLVSPVYDPIDIDENYVKITKEKLAEIERVRRNNSRHGEKRIFVNFVDGGGWPECAILSD